MRSSLQPFLTLALACTLLASASTVFVHLLDGQPAQALAGSSIDPGRVRSVRSVNGAEPGTSGNVEVSDRVIAVGSVAADHAIPLDVAAVYTLTLVADVTLTTTAAPTTRSRVVQVFITAAGTRAFAFEPGWLWVGPRPDEIADTVQGLLTLSPMGGVIVASWQELGDGS